MTVQPNSWEPLNGMLMQGPYLTNNLVGVLTRFRLETIALASDIKAMFHQAKVNPKDRNAVKFLWWPDGDLEREAATYQITVHLFGATSSPSCAGFALQKAAKRYGGNDLTKSKELVLKNFYVGDCLFSPLSAEEGIALTWTVSETL